ncbi:MAG: hypothetical protein IT442_01830 [Phycisphaeraceae bacterium]|nr:hypothetical protein [Phycisphaeraceae bacterium]
MTHSTASIGVDSPAPATLDATPARGRRTLWIVLAVLLALTVAGWAVLAAAIEGVMARGILASEWSRGLGDVPIGWPMAIVSTLMLALVLIRLRLRLSERLIRLSRDLLLIGAVGLLGASACLAAGSWLWGHDIMALDRESDGLWLWRAINGLSIVVALAVLFFGARELAPTPARRNGSTAAQGIAVVIYGLALMTLLAGPALANLWALAGMPSHPLAQFRKITPNGKNLFFDTGPGPDRRFMVGYDFEIRPHEMPIYGSPDAEQFIFFWFDYTDLRSREQYQNLRAAMRRYGGRVAIVPLLFPISPDGNKFFMFQPIPQRNADAGMLARLAVAVWIAKPQDFASFHDWLLDAPACPSADQARRHAAELVGEQALQSAMADPRVYGIIARCVELKPPTGQDRSIPITSWLGDSIGAHFVEPEKICEAVTQSTGILTDPTADKP